MFNPFKKNLTLVVILLASTFLRAADTLPSKDILAENFAIPVWSEIDESAPSVTLRFLYAGDYEIYRREYGQTSWGSVYAASTGAAATSWTDTNVSLGKTYEYAIYDPDGSYSGSQSYYYTNGMFGYITVGLNFDNAKARGTVILVMADNIIASNEARLETLFKDLVGDGWQVRTIITPTFVDNYFEFDTNSYGVYGYNQPEHLRNEIRRIYEETPEGEKILYFLGHTPHALTATSMLHPDHHGSRSTFATDHYYADIDGIWTDENNSSSTMNVGGPADVIHTLPNRDGDGIFDQNVIPSAVEMGFGRVDPYDLSRADWYATPQTHAGRVANYLDKAHRFKHYQPFGLAGSEALAGRKAVFRGTGGNQEGAIAEGADLVAIFGADHMDPHVATNTLPATQPPNVEISNGINDNDIQYSIENGPFLYYGKNSGGPIGSPYQGDQTVNSFGMQSWWGDFWRESSARLGIMNPDNMMLTWMYSGRFKEKFHLHPLGIGEPFGTSIKLTSNFERDEYLTGEIATRGHYWETYERRDFLRQMAGDPTLRLFPVPPVSNVTATPTGGDVSLTWDAPSDLSEFVEYRIYRADDLLGEFTEIASGLTTPAYTDTSAPVGSKIYMVKAVHKVEMGSGSFLTNAQGIFASVGLQIDTAVIPSFPIGEDALFNLAASGDTGGITWTLSSGILPPGLELLSDGTIQGNPISSGHYPVVFTATDQSAQNVSRRFSLFVDGAQTQTLDIDLREVGGMGLINKTELTRDFTLRGNPTFDANGGMIFDGVDDAIQVHNMLKNTENSHKSYLPGNRSDSGFTITGVFKTEVGGTGGVIISKGLNNELAWPDTLNQYTVKMLSDGTLRCLASNRRVTTSNTYNDGQWHHFAMTLPVEAPDSLIHFYVDGVDVGSSGDGRHEVTEDLLIGARWDGSDAATTEHFKGTISDVAIYKSGMTPGNVKALYERFAQNRVDITPAAPVISGLPSSYYINADSTVLIDFDITDANGETPRLFATSDRDDFCDHFEVVRQADGYALKVITVAAAAGAANITIYADDGWPGMTAEAVIQLKVPGAADDVIALNNAPQFVDLLANDVASPGNTVSISEILTEPTVGYIELIDGQAYFHPPANWNEEISFVYEILESPSGEITTATATLVPGHHPIANNDAYAESGVGPFTLDVLANDSDPQGEQLTLVRITQPGKGRAVVEAGQIVYTPYSADFGLDGFSYDVMNESGFYATGVVQIQAPSTAVALVDMEFEEGTGTTTANSGTLSTVADGTLDGTASWVAGAEGAALYFDGSTALDLGNPAGLQFNPENDSFSVSMAVNLEDSTDLYSGTFTLLSKEAADGSATQFALKLSSSGIAVSMGDSSATNASALPSIYSYFEYCGNWFRLNESLGPWRVVQVVHDASTRELSIYVDYYLVASIDTSGWDIDMADNGQNWLVGAESDGAGGYRNGVIGTIDQLKIFDHAIEPETVSRNLIDSNHPALALAPLVKASLSEPLASSTVEVNQPVTLTPDVEHLANSADHAYYSYYIRSPDYQVSYNLETETPTFTPTQSGNWYIRLSYTTMIDGAGLYTSSQTQYLSVGPSAIPGTGLAITSAANLGSSLLNGSYSQALTGTGGTPPYTWTLEAGTLPVGISLAADGTLSGTPSAPGLYEFTLNLTDSSSGQDDQSFKLVVLPVEDSDDDKLPDDWENTYASGLSLAPDGNDDFDQYTNLIEYVFGGDPTLSDGTSFIQSSITQGVLANGSNRYMRLQFPRRNLTAGITGIVKSSPDLVNWEPITVEEKILTNDGEMSEIQVDIPMGPHESLFFLFEVY